MSLFVLTIYSCVMIFYKNTSFTELYGNDETTFTLDRLCDFYKLSLLKAEDDVKIYYLNHQTREIEIFNVEECIKGFIEDTENNMGITDDNEDENNDLYHLRVFGIKYLGGVYSGRIHDMEEYYKQQAEYYGDEIKGEHGIGIAYNYAK